MTLPSNLTWTLHVGAALYAINLGVGVSAQVLHTKFGVLHHGLYALVFAAAIAAAIFSFHPALLATLAALAIMPLTKPRTPRHPAVASVGALGYLGAYLL